MSAASWRHPLLWIRWLLTLVGFTGMTVAVVIAIRAGNGSTTQDRAAIEADRLGRILEAQDQAPHEARLVSTASPRSALQAAIAADVRARVRHHELGGPVEGSRCRLARQTAGRRRAFRCTIRAGGVGYPFLGVVDLSARRVVWCKRDPPPSPSLDIPVSRRCRA